ncbi:hypothetical protein [Bacillus sp. CRN 9]|uniref:hypothetical protein n=1 Tax=Cytobacillus horneckiae TaxID=549687 RepID=UPI001562E088|nr:hypothetical protein [Bacillus sp. CRN 9]
MVFVGLDKVYVEFGIVPLTHNVQKVAGIWLANSLAEKKLKNWLFFFIRTNNFNEQNVFKSFNVF